MGPGPFGAGERIGGSHADPAPGKASLGTAEGNVRLITARAESSAAREAAGTASQAAGPSPRALAVTRAPRTFHAPGAGGSGAEGARGEQGALGGEAARGAEAEAPWPRSGRARG